jgi:FG-GAP-like repeat/ASPIC and UnbV
MKKVRRKRSKSGGGSRANQKDKTRSRDSPVASRRAVPHPKFILLLLLVTGIAAALFFPPALLPFHFSGSHPPETPSPAAGADVICGAAPHDPADVAVGPPPAGTRHMIALLDQMRREAEAHPIESAYLSREMVGYCRQELRRTTQPARVANLRVQLALNLLRAGQSANALEELESVERDAPRSGLSSSRRQLGQLRVLRALCCLRMGEQENCLSNHTSESCLVPIRGGGVHKHPRGSRAAIAILKEQLVQFPTDLKSAWLLNIACMTVGDYPDKVPSRWRLPPRVFKSDYDIKRFPDVAAEVGLRVDGLAGGSIMEDFNGDGFLDLMISDWSLSGQLRYFENQGDGTFAERTRRAGLSGLVSGLNIMQTDYNNDGWPDVFITRGGWLGKAGHHPNSLLRNNGDGTFADVTEQAGLLSFHPTQTAVWFDFDGDGWLDVFIGNESFGSEVHPCELYRNNGDGTFTECAGAAGIAFVRFVKGVAAGDYNHDGQPDLYLSVGNGSNLLLRNDGPLESAHSGIHWHFSEVGMQAGVTGPTASFPTWFFDYDNDGWLDLFVSDYGARDSGDVMADYLGKPTTADHARLYHNNHDGTFADVSSQAGLDKVLMAMGSNYGDLDNDGWLDFYVGTGDPDFSTIIPNRMFRNDGGKRFQDVTTSGGFGHIQKGHGVAFGDWDNDGDQDVFIKMGGAYSGDNYRCSLFLNPGHGNHWITLKLEGVRSNRAAIGARIRVLVETADGERSIYKTVSSGGSFGSSPLRQEIGLGQAKSIRDVEIYWPATGQTQRVHNLAMDRIYRIREGSGAAVAWNPKRVPNSARSGTPSAPRRGSLAVLSEHGRNQ